MVRRLDHGELRWTLRCFGAGGFCGWYGLFTNSRVGTFWCCVTNFDDLVLIVHTGGEQLVISPDRPD